MNKDQINKLDDMTLELKFDLAVLNSAVKDFEKLEIYMLENFIEKLYENSKVIRDIFENDDSYL